MAAVAKACANGIWRQQVVPWTLQTRSFATLKDISLRLKSVKNIKKITKSMKMVAAAKYSRAERELKPARAYGQGAAAVVNKVELVSQDDNTDRKPKHLLICMTSDRGLCGSIHSGIARSLRGMFNEGKLPQDTKLVLVGDKLRSILQRTHRDNILMSFKDVGRLPPIFAEASFIAEEVLKSDYDFESVEIVFNTFKSVVSFRTTLQPFVPLRTLLDSSAMSIYDDCDAEVLRCYHEMTLANLIYYGLKEGACSEHSSRMTAMDAASKNASEMIEKLTLTYNRTRQAVITRELIEIISGAAAL